MKHHTITDYTRHIFFTLLIVGLFYLVLPVKAADQTAPIIPAENFASLPNFFNAKLSPSGEDIAYFTTHQGRRMLVMQKLDGSNRKIIPPVGDSDFRRYWWGNDNRLILSYEVMRRRGGSYTVQTLETRLAGIDRDGSNFKWMIKQPERRARSSSKTRGSKLTSIVVTAQFQDNIISLLPDEPDHILLSIDSDMDGRSEIWRINIKNGLYTEKFGGMRGVQYWYADHTHEPRLGTGFDKSEFVVYVKNAQGNFSKVSNQSWGDNFTFLGFSEDPNIIYVKGTNGQKTHGLYKLALDGGEVVEKVFHHPDVDIRYIKDNPETGLPAGVVYAVDHESTFYFDKNLAKVQKTIDRAIMGVNHIVGKAKGKEIYLIKSETDTDSGAYYYYNRMTKNIAFIAPSMNNIDPAQMASTKRVDIEARDGTIIHSYLTLPQGKEEAKGLPTVILPHGGPYDRTLADWDFWSQFLANRGYAVLRPNYRGSRGYGPAFDQAGDNQWGGLMQDDVTDATKWLISEGIADSNRICISGSGYGGYAALMGTIKEQDLYKCAISVNGITDLPGLKTRDKFGYIGGRNWTKRMGLEGKDDKEVSPFHRAGDVNVPVLLMASKDSVRINATYAPRMHEALKKKKKDSTYVEIEDGGRDMDTEASRLTMLKAVESFLAKHLN